MDRIRKQITDLQATIARMSYPVIDTQRLHKFADEFAAFDRHIIARELKNAANHIDSTTVDLAEAVHAQYRPYVARLKTENDTLKERAEVAEAEAERLNRCLRVLRAKAMRSDDDMTAALIEEALNGKRL